MPSHVAALPTSPSRRDQQGVSTAPGRSGASFRRSHQKVSVHEPTGKATTHPSLHATATSLGSFTNLRRRLSNTARDDDDDACDKGDQKHHVNQNKKQPAPTTTPLSVSIPPHSLQQIEMAFRAVAMDMNHLGLSSTLLTSGLRNNATNTSTVAGEATAASPFYGDSLSPHPATAVGSFHSNKQQIKAIEKMEALARAACEDTSIGELSLKTLKDIFYVAQRLGVYVFEFTESSCTFPAGSSSHPASPAAGGKGLASSFPLPTAFTQGANNEAHPPPPPTFLTQHEEMKVVMQALKANNVDLEEFHHATENQKRQATKNRQTIANHRLAASGEDNKMDDIPVPSLRDTTVARYTEFVATVWWSVKERPALRGIAPRGRSPISSPTRPPSTMNSPAVVPDEQEPLLPYPSIDEIPKQLPDDHLGMTFVEFKRFLQAWWWMLAEKEKNSEDQGSKVILDSSPETKIQKDADATLFRLLAKATESSGASRLRSPTTSMKNSNANPTERVKKKAMDSYIQREFGLRVFDDKSGDEDLDDALEEHFVEPQQQPQQQTMNNKPPLSSTSVSDDDDFFSRQRRRRSTTIGTHNHSKSHSGKGNTKGGAAQSSSKEKASEVALWVESLGSGGERTCDFYPSESYKGSKEGFYFGRGILGMGYYRLAKLDSSDKNSDVSTSATMMGQNGSEAPNDKAEPPSHPIFGRRHHTATPAEIKAQQQLRVKSADDEEEEEEEPATSLSNGTQSAIVPCGTPPTNPRRRSEDAQTFRQQQSPTPPPPLLPTTPESNTAASPAPRIRRRVTLADDADVVVVLGNKLEQTRGVSVETVVAAQTVSSNDNDETVAHTTSSCTAVKDPPTKDLRTANVDGKIGTSRFASSGSNTAKVAPLSVEDLSVKQPPSIVPRQVVPAAELVTSSAEASNHLRVDEGDENEQFAATTGSAPLLDSTGGSLGDLSGSGFALTQNMSETVGRFDSFALPSALKSANKNSTTNALLTRGKLNSSQLLKRTIKRVGESKRHLRAMEFLTRFELESLRRLSGVSEVLFNVTVLYVMYMRAHKVVTPMQKALHKGTSDHERAHLIEKLQDDALWKRWKHQCAEASIAYQQRLKKKRERQQQQRHRGSQFATTLDGGFDFDDDDDGAGGGGGGSNRGSDAVPYTQLLKELDAMLMEMGGLTIEQEELLEKQKRDAEENGAAMTGFHDDFDGSVGGGLQAEGTESFGALMSEGTFHSGDLSPNTTGTASPRHMNDSTVDKKHHQQQQPSANLLQEGGFFDLEDHSEEELSFSEFVELFDDALDGEDSEFDDHIHSDRRGSSAHHQSRFFSDMISRQLERLNSGMHLEKPTKAAQHHNRAYFLSTGSSSSPGLPTGAAHYSDLDFVAPSPLHSPRGGAPGHGDMMRNDSFGAAFTATLTHSVAVDSPTTNTNFGGGGSGGDGSPFMARLKELLTLQSQRSQTKLNPLGDDDGLEENVRPVLAVRFVSAADGETTSSDGSKKNQKCKAGRPAELSSSLLMGPRPPSALKSPSPNRQAGANRNRSKSRSSSVASAFLERSPRRMTNRSVGAFDQSLRSSSSFGGTARRGTTATVSPSPTSRHNQLAIDNLAFSHDQFTKTRSKKQLEKLMKSKPVRLPVPKREDVAGEMYGNDAAFAGRGFTIGGGHGAKKQTTSGKNTNKKTKAFMPRVAKIAKEQGKEARAAFLQRQQQQQSRSASAMGQRDRCVRSTTNRPMTPASGPPSEVEPTEEERQVTYVHAPKDIVESRRRLQQGYSGQRADQAKMRAMVEAFNNKNKEAMPPASSCSANNTQRRSDASLMIDDADDVASQATSSLTTRGML